MISVVFPLSILNIIGFSSLDFREGLGMNILHAPNFRTGVAFNFYGGRSDILKGLQDIDTGFDAGAFGSITKVFSKNNISTRHLE